MTIERLVKLKDLLAKAEFNLQELRTAYKTAPLARKEVWLFWRQDEIEAAISKAESAVIRLNKIISKASIEVLQYNLN